MLRYGMTIPILYVLNETYVTVGYTSGSFYGQIWNPRVLNAVLYQEQINKIFENERRWFGV